MHIKQGESGILDRLDVLDRVMYVLCWPTFSRTSIVGIYADCWCVIVANEIGAVYTVKLSTSTLNPKGTVALAGRLLWVPLRRTVDAKKCCY